MKQMQSASEHITLKSKKWPLRFNAWGHFWLFDFSQKLYINRDINTLRERGKILLLDFIIKYWTEFLFGIVAAGILAGGRYIWTLFKNRLKDSLEEQITNITDVITKRMSETDEKLEAKNTSLTQQIGELQADMKTM